MTICAPSVAAALSEMLKPVAVCVVVWSVVALTLALRSRLLANYRAATWLRLQAVVEDAVAAVNQRLCAIIGRTYDPRVPGGRGLSHSEALKLSATATTYVKTSIGPAGMLHIARTLGLSKENEANTRRAVDNVVALLIEAEVWRSKQPKPDKEAPCK